MKGDGMAPNPVPSGLSAPVGYEPPNPANLGIQNRWNEMDDNDGFPVGFMILILVVFVGLLYRKSSQNREASSATTRDSSRGGYEPVAMAQRYHAE